MKMKLGTLNGTCAAALGVACTFGLAGCETAAPAPPAVVPAALPGTPIPGGLAISSAVVNPYNLASDNVTNFRTGTVIVVFNGAATQPGRVTVEAQEPGWTIYKGAGSASFVPGQTEVRVPITVHSDQTARIPLKVSIAGAPASAGFQTSAYTEVKK